MPESVQVREMSEAIHRDQQSTDRLSILADILPICYQTITVAISEFCLCLILIIKLASLE